MQFFPANISIDQFLSGVCGAYSNKLMADLGIIVHPVSNLQVSHPVDDWLASGLLHSRNGAIADKLCPVPLASCAIAAMKCFCALSDLQIPDAEQGAKMLGCRSLITGFIPMGTQSAGKSCHLISSLDGQIALNLARPQDWESLPALFATEAPVCDWESVRHHSRQLPTKQLLDSGRLLGLAIADALASDSSTPSWFRIPFSVHNTQEALRQTPLKPSPVIIDLSSLWAGPLCSYLWQQAGAHIIKVESTGRPDGARQGNLEFYQLINQGKQSVSLALDTRQGQKQLENLIRQADIVIEGSRPRALRQMGIHAEALLASNPGLTWLSISAYGRGKPAQNWPGYGDETAVAAGLSRILYQVCGTWRFCGDAIADPLTGLHAALAGWTAWRSGGGKLIELSLYDVVRHCIAVTAPQDNDYSRRYREWKQYLLQIPARPAIEKLTIQCSTAKLGQHNHLYLQPESTFVKNVCGSNLAAR
ncbi:CoA transferase [Microbulbifer sp. 2205BS26-8]|uniref:CoA transferase n=1 Tax=Microbulbifer sp. 2205BS26-8 TaxID=3064386 RepID=UPI00274010C7|nr:CoA transferase [Microbulbifer sp. 2205BS26-8]MDP5209541.1 CoA transferase [Microbulbifer sp. 2205BS26-8]